MRVSENSVLETKADMILFSPSINVIWCVNKRGLDALIRDNYSEWFSKKMINI